MKITFEEFVEKYVPIKNHIDTNASYDGMAFETYGEELEFVKKQNPANIWTVVDSDSGNYPIITNGFHYVNRLSYIITEKPCEEEFVDVIDEE
jgi:hypothetical protein